jgi:polyhydroxyalkanoate synthesis regulator phasin
MKEFEEILVKMSQIIAETNAIESSELPVASGRISVLRQKIKELQSEIDIEIAKSYTPLF